MQKHVILKFDVFFTYYYFAIFGYGCTCYNATKFKILLHERSNFVKATIR